MADAKLVFVGCVGSPVLCDERWQGDPRATGNTSTHKLLRHWCLLASFFSQYLKLVMDSYRATIVFETEDGPIISQDESDGEANGIYAEDEEGWDPDGEGEGDPRESQEDERLDASGFASERRVSTSASERREFNLTGLTWEDRRPSSMAESEGMRSERSESSNGVAGDGAEPEKRESSAAIGGAHQEEEGESEISADFAGGRLSWSERFERLLKKDERTGAERKLTCEDTGVISGRNDRMPLQAGQLGASLVEDLLSNSLLGKQRKSLHRIMSPSIPEQVVGDDATELGLSLQSSDGVQKQYLAIQSTGELDTF